MIIKLVTCVPIEKSKQLGRKVIQFFDKSKGSHFAICLITDWSTRYYEAVWPKSRQIEEEEWLKHYSIVKEWTFEVPVELRADVIGFLQSMVGIWYAAPQILMIGLSALFWPLRKLFNKSILNHEKAIICSEYGSRFVERFFNIVLTKSHDNIGVRDMELISEEASKVKNIWKIKNVIS